MVNNFDDYEKDYLERMEKKKIEEDLERNQEYAKRKREELAKKEEYVKDSLANLTVRDYFVLDAVKKDDMTITFKLGTIEQLDIFEKLYTCGLIKKLDRKLTFDERERLEKFKDSPAYKQHEARLKRMMDDELSQRLEKYCRNCNIESENDTFEVSELGNEYLDKKREQIKNEWTELETLYDKKEKVEFREKLEERKNNLILYITMGFTNGAMMGIMMSKMDMNHEMYMQGIQQMYSQGYTYGVNDTGDFSGGDSGGFMDGGFQPGF
tara:strand:+ start:72 stop:872 length:801 start_codon:yes stop_codon:yes gene_type:complete